MTEEKDVQLSFEEILEKVNNGSLDVFVNSNWLEAYQNAHPDKTIEDFLAPWFQSAKSLEAAIDTEVLIFQEKGFAESNAVPDPGISPN